MKNTKLNKIVILALSCLLLVGAVIGISASAEETPAVQIKYKNIAYEGAIQVLYAVEAENIPTGGKVQMYFYDAEPTTDSIPSYVKDEYTEKELIIGEKTYHAFFSYGIAPKNMRAPIYAKAVIVDAEGAVVAKSEMSEYSVWQYAVNRFEKSPTPDQKKLYAATLNYGASVQEMLVESKKLTVEEILANGGWANEYCGIQLNSLYQGRDVGFESEITYYAPGTKITSMIADSVKKYGTANAALHEVLDENGDKFTTSYIATAPGLTTFTANYMPGHVNALDYEYEDVDAIHKYNASDATLKALGYKIEKFGTSKTTNASSSIVKDENGNSYLYAQSNGTRGGLSAYWTLTSDMKISHSKSFDVAFFETDFRWDGYGDDVTSYQDAVYLRIFTGGGTNGDYNTAAFICLQDQGAGSDTFRIGIYGPGSDYYTLMPKGEWFNMRLVCIPTADGKFINEFYINGELIQTYTWDGKRDATDTDYMGTVLFTRNHANTSSKLAYAVDNTYAAAYTTYTPGNGGMFADESEYGTKLDFESGTLTDWVADCPADRGNINGGTFNYSLEKVGSGIGFKNLNPKTGNVHIVEFDYKFNGANTTKVNAHFGWFGLAETGRNKADHFLPMMLYVNSIEDGEVTSVKITTQYNDTALVTLQRDTWYNVRLVYIANNTTDDSGNVKYGGTVNLFLNGKLVSTFTAQGYVDSKDTDSESNTTFEMFGFEMRSTVHSYIENVDMTFDNIYLDTIEQ